MTPAEVAVAIFLVAAAAGLYRRGRELWDDLSSPEGR